MAYDRSLRDRGRSQCGVGTAELDCELQGLRCKTAPELALEGFLWQRSAAIRIGANRTSRPYRSLRLHSRRLSGNCGCLQRITKAPSNSKSGRERIKTRNTFRTISLR